LWIETQASQGKIDVRPKTIRAKVALLTGAVSLLVVLGFGLFLYFSLRIQLLRSVDETLELRAQQLIAAVLTGDGQPRFDRTALASLEAVREDSATLVSAEGEPIDQLNQEPLPVLAVSFEEGARFQTARFSENEASGETEQEIYRVLILPIVDNEELIAYLQVGQDIEAVQEALSGLQRLLLLTGPFLVGLAFIGGYYLAARALSPMEKIRQQAAAIEARDLHLRLSQFVQEDEVGSLARTFNALLDRLERSFNRQLRFTADASHELRTPLAIVQGTIDVALERPRSQEEYVEALHSIGPEVQRMTRLVNELLMLARADANELLLEFETIDLVDLLRLAVDTMRARAGEAGNQFQDELPSQIMLRGDRDRLLELFFNLIENAILYAPGSPVTIGGEDLGEQTRVWVADRGPGIPLEHLAHLFERFYQVDSSRERRSQGSGLGLAIAQEIARLHGGAISVQSVPGQGTTFVVELNTGRLQ
jgi:heavy metal sensor kinase